ncbi:ATPase, T2SS/T4P/T4SS family [Novipirellula sp. SH528]|uniref:ATPase, T2SS/T4P/T4SS family n=1 Tax=Novipirellula sp. SH528 TaxID=3454466 RepID=UPI003F9F4197
MLLRYFNQFDGQPLLAKVASDRIHVGSAVSNDIVLQSPFIDHESVVLRRGDDSWQVQVLGKNGCELDGKKHHSGSSLVWDGSSRLSIFPYVFQVQSDQSAENATVGRLIAQTHDLMRNIHLDILQQMHDSQSSVDIPDDTESLLHIERSIESSAKHHGLTSNDNAALVAELAGCCVRDELLNLLLANSSESEHQGWQANAAWSEFATTVPVHEDELNRWTLACAKKLFSKTDSSKTEARIAIVDARFWNLWDELSPGLIQTFGFYLALRNLKKQIKDILFGFGPLEDLLRIPTISEIMVNSSHEIYIERSGVLQNSGRKFVSDEVTTTVIERIVGMVGRRIDTAQPMVDARLPDGSRVNAVIPPLAVKGPCLTIRKFSKQRFTMPKLIEIGSVSTQVASFLSASVRAKKSILISGGTGTGKTTLLNCLSQAIPFAERIICIEDTHELQLDHPHVVFLECRDGNNEGKGKVAIRDLVKNALRQRPDRVVVGECRSDEAIDMLQAMNTGHSGSMTTIHANTPEDALRRLEVLVRDSGLPSDAIRQQIVSAIDIVVQITRLPSGHRIISGVTEVLRFDESSQTIRLRPIFHSRFDDETQSLKLAPTGCIPTFAGELVRDGHIKLDLFLRGIETVEAEEIES